MGSIGPGQTFALAVWETFHDKLIEINMNESTTTHLLHDFTIDQKGIVRGILKDAIGDALVLECNVGTKPKIVIINCWSVHCICEYDGNGTIADIYHNEDRRKHK